MTWKKFIRLTQNKRLSSTLLAVAILSIPFFACRLPNAQDQEISDSNNAPLTVDTPILPDNSTPPDLYLTATPAVAGPFKSLMDVENAPLGKLNDAWLAGNGDLWVSSDKGVYVFKAQKWSRVLQHNAGQIMGQDNAGKIWILLDNGDSIAAIYNSKIILYDSQKGWGPVLHDNSVLYGFGDGLASDSNGRVWVATGQDDLRRYDPDKDIWEKITSDQMGLRPASDLQMAGNQITNVLAAKDGKVWVSSCSSSVQTVSGQTVQVFDGNRWSSLQETAGQCVRDMKSDASGNIWLGGFDQIMTYNPILKKWNHIPLPFYQRRQLVFSIKIDPSQKPWVEVGLGGGASLWDATARYHLEGAQWVEDLSPNGWVLSDLSFNPDGEGWLCADGVVYQNKGGKMQKVVEMDMYDCRMAAGSNGIVFLAALNGQDQGIWQIVK